MPFFLNLVNTYNTDMNSQYGHMFEIVIFICFEYIKWKILYILAIFIYR